MRGLRSVGAIVVAVGTALALSAPAHADLSPHCDSQIWSRPGAERTLEIVCANTDRVRIAAQPEHGELVGERFDGYAFRFTLRTDDDAPESDHVRLELDARPDGATQDIEIHNVPLARNSAPVCEPFATAQRSDGIEHPEIDVPVRCQDADHDPMTMDGNGPGQWLDTPQAMDIERYAYWAHYRTAVTAGPEQASYWATDSQGARSNVAPVSLEVGPQVDRRPECMPNPAEFIWEPTLHYPVYMRAGATRRFGVYCSDADGDAIDPRVVLPPLAGRLTRFEAGEPQTGWWGVERFVDVTYVPNGPSPEPDRLGVLAAGPRGPGEVADIRMTPVPDSEDFPSGCGWGGGSTVPGEPITVTASCDDREGDPLRASVTRQPAHGTTDDPVLTEAGYGQTSIAVTYRPEEGFEGNDSLMLRVEDGQGVGYDLDFDLRVDKPLPPTPPPQWEPGPDAEGWFWSPASWARRPTPAPATDQAPATTPERQARVALRTKSVRLVRRLGDARMFAPRTPPRIAKGVRALAVTCAVRCRVVATGRVAGDGARRRLTARGAPGHAALLTLPLTPRQRRAIQAARGGWLSFDVRARPVAGRSGAARMRVRVARARR